MSFKILLQIAAVAVLHGANSNPAENNFASAIHISSSRGSESESKSTIEDKIETKGKLNAIITGLYLRGWLSNSLSSEQEHHGGHSNEIKTPEDEDQYFRYLEDEAPSETSRYLEGESPTQTFGPTFHPTVTDSPTRTFGPTFHPTVTDSPTTNDTPAPTNEPTRSPTEAPTKKPTQSPIKEGETAAPAKSPTKAPTRAPTREPTQSPTKKGDTRAPTKSPTQAPTKAPTQDEESSEDEGPNDENLQSSDSTPPPPPPIVVVVVAVPAPEIEPEVPAPDPFAQLIPAFDPNPVVVPNNNNNNRGIYNPLNNGGDIGAQQGLAGTSLRRPSSLLAQRQKEAEARKTVIVI